jgi:glucose-1-phosphate adenylyltransferase
MPESQVVAFVMAGGEGQRLRPYTERLPKPALRIGTEHRIIDFALSSLHNSGIRRIFVLLQYRPQPLVRHLAENWTLTGSKNGEFVQAVLPLGLGQGRGFAGTADAVHQSLALLDGSRADIVAVFAADHIYRMDVRQMVAFHEACAADATVAAVPVPREQATELGVIQTDGGARIRGFEEKPSDPAPLPGDQDRCLASMGNYLFRPGVLRSALAEAAARGEHDFGRHVLPRLVETRRVYAYDFSMNVVPGAWPQDESTYWRDVGTVDAYVAAQWDLLGPRPRFRLDNPYWPIRPGGAARSERPADGGSHARGSAGPERALGEASITPARPAGAAPPASA